MHCLQDTSDVELLQKVENEMQQSVADAKAEGAAKLKALDAAKKALEDEKSGAQGSSKHAMAEGAKKQKAEQDALADAKTKIGSSLDAAKTDLKKVPRRCVPCRPSCGSFFDLLVLVRRCKTR